MAQVYVSIGSNIERERNIDTALQALAGAYGKLQQSSVYESAAVGFDSTPFYNLVVAFQTDASPQMVQETLHRIEDNQGRLRAGELAARTLDLDLLLGAGPASAGPAAHGHGRVLERACELDSPKASLPCRHVGPRRCESRGSGAGAPAKEAELGHGPPGRGASVRVLIGFPPVIGRSALPEPIRRCLGRA